MKRIMAGEIYEAIPESSGMVFSHLKNLTETGDIHLGYKMLTYETREVINVENNIYFLSKFGANYQKIIKHCKNYITVRALTLSENKVFLLESDGSAFLFDSDGEPVWQGSLIYKSKVPAAITVAKDGLWGSFPDLDAIVRFNATTMRCELRLGKKGDIFNAPKGLFAEDNFLYVSSYGGQKLIKVDLDTFKTEDVYGFNEPLFAYTKAGNHEFVTLVSGLYEIV